MKPWQAAHLRLLEILPVRTHQAKARRADTNWRRRCGGVKEKQAIVIKGVRYHSLTAAATAMEVSRPALVYMIKRGEAVYE